MELEKQISFPIQEIQQFIPQSFPFVMVDEIVSFSESTLESTMTPVEDNIFVKQGVFTEPGLIENMAQTIALHTGFDCFLNNKPTPLGFIGSIKKIEIKSLPKSNQTITTKAEILQEFAGVSLVQVSSFDTSGELIATGQMKTVIVDD